MPDEDDDEEEEAADAVFDEAAALVAEREDTWAGGGGGLIATGMRSCCMSCMNQSVVASRFVVSKPRDKLECTSDARLDRNGVATACTRGSSVRVNRSLSGSSARG